MRVYDPRAGRFLIVDPLTKSYPKLTPYQFASNTPIEGIDLDGGEVSHTQMFRGHMYESLPSDAIRHPIPAGAYLPSNGAAAGGSANAKRGAFVAGAVVIGVVAAPVVGLIAEKAFWNLALWASLPQNQILVGEGVTFAAGALNPGPEDISPGSSSDELGRAAGQPIKKVSRIVKQAFARAAANTKIVELEASSIRFTQTSVNGVETLVESMSANGWKGDPIDVVKMSDGLLTSVDNTRVLAAQLSGTKVKAVVHAFEEAIPAGQAERFILKKTGAVPTTWGQAAEFRIQNQSASFRNAYPNGSTVQLKTKAQ
jgi:hypothetical protein